MGISFQVFINFVKQQVEIMREPEDGSLTLTPGGQTELHSLGSDESLETPDEEDLPARLDQVGVGQLNVALPPYTPHENSLQYTPLNHQPSHQSPMFPVGLSGIQEPLFPVSAPQVAVHNVPVNIVESLIPVGGMQEPLYPIHPEPSPPPEYEAWQQDETGHGEPAAVCVLSGQPSQPQRLHHIS